jgi:hypothetical protein
MPAKPCAPNCRCGKHNRTAAHNTRIGISVSLTAQAYIGRGINPLTKVKR